MWNQMSEGIALRVENKNQFHFANCFGMRLVVKLYYSSAAIEEIMTAVKDVNGKCCSQTLPHYEQFIFV